MLNFSSEIGIIVSCHTHKVCEDARKRSNAHIAFNITESRHNLFLIKYTHKL